MLAVQTGKPPCTGTCIGIQGVHTPSIVLTHFIVTVVNIYKYITIMKISMQSSLDISYFIFVFVETITQPC